MSVLGTPRPRWRIAVSVGLAAALLWLFFRNAEWPVLVDGFRSIGWRLLGAAILLRLASLVVSSIRWQVLLSPVRRLPLPPIVTAMMKGMAVSALVSMQAAEVARPYFLSERTGVDFRAALATVSVEWFFDLLSVLALFVPAEILATRGALAAGLGLNAAIATVLAASVGCLAALYATLRSLDRIRAWVHRSRIVPARFRARLATHLEQFASGLAILARPRGVAAAAAYSILTSVLTAVSAWLALMAFGLPVPFLTGFIVLGIVTIGGMSPTPGAVGGFHAVCQLGLVALLHIDPAQTVAPVIGLHAVLYLPPAAIGALGFLSTRVDRRGVPACES